MVGRHMAVGARAAVSAEAMQPPVEEGLEAARDSVTGLVAAGKGVNAEFGSGMPVERHR